MRALVLLLLALAAALPAAAQPCHGAATGPAATHADAPEAGDAATGEAPARHEATGDVPAPLAGTHPCGAPPDALCACCVSSALAPAAPSAERQPTAAVVGAEREERTVTPARVVATPVRGPPRAVALRTQGPRGPPATETPRA